VSDKRDPSLLFVPPLILDRIQRVLEAPRVLAMYSGFQENEICSMLYALCQIVAHVTEKGYIENINVFNVSRPKTFAIAS